MSSSNVDAPISIAIYGHVSASPQHIAEILNGTVASNVAEECDVAVFVINPAGGIDQPTIDMWHAYDELQTPRMVIVTVLEGMELDFDDAVLLANRVFDPLVTPYLVLHGESGTPIGTISLLTCATTDYSTNPPTIGVGDNELQELIREFREEYLEQVSEMDEGAFAAGILFPAIPFNAHNGLGLDIVRQYLDELPRRS